MAKWEKEWIDEAERLTRQEYTNSYKDLPVDLEEPSIVLTAQAQKRVCNLLFMRLIVLTTESALECISVNQHV